MFNFNLYKRIFFKKVNLIDVWLLITLALFATQVMFSAFTQMSAQSAFFFHLCIQASVLLLLPLVTMSAIMRLRTTVKHEQTLMYIKRISACCLGFAFVYCLQTVFMNYSISRENNFLNFLAGSIIIATYIGGILQIFINFFMLLKFPRPLTFLSFVTCLFLCFIFYQSMVILLQIAEAI